MKTIAIAIVAVTAFFAARASAQTTPDPAATPGQPYAQPGYLPPPGNPPPPVAAPDGDRPIATADADHPALATGIGMTAEAGGGVGGFLDSRATDATTAQGIWDVRLTLGSRVHLGGELAYVGSAQGLNTFGVSQDAKLIGNGAEGSLRWNVLTGMWQPYLSAGIGWTHYTVTNTATNTSDVQTDGDVFQVPLAAGLAFRYQGFVADARFAYHPAANSPVFRDVNLSTWDLGGRVGFEF